ncbi:hypothetical protein FJT64_014708 [Amphibalanus amphitrite]|uniref:Chitin-binding type-2 domain-containing protein n=1 Tax=Amphibalanus amphitrite TaxID=1232801 RepID=A0A6A4V6I6_AMPAM|nr:hypothetical protein FJT64_014708 [Amphibalanus amphitrite]
MLFQSGCSSEQLCKQVVCPTDTTQYHFAKEDNCRQFYKCSNGCPVVFDCAAPLSYNSAISNCDWDYNTGCTDPPLT